MESVCASCRSPKAESQCGLCSAALCRKCRLFLDEGAFSIAPDARPIELKHTFYCGPCHDSTVEPFRTAYDETLEKAKKVNVLYKGSKSTFRLIRKAKKAVDVAGIPDRDQTILTLAFLAAQAGFSALIDVEVTSQKVRNAGWQTSAWAGHGIPADITSHVGESD